MTWAKVVDGRCVRHDEPVTPFAGICMSCHRAWQVADDEERRQRDAEGLRRVAVAGIVAAWRYRPGPARTEAELRRAGWRLTRALLERGE